MRVPFQTRFFRCDPHATVINDTASRTFKCDFLFTGIRMCRVRFWNGWKSERMLKSVKKWIHREREFNMRFHVWYGFLLDVIQLQLSAINICYTWKKQNSCKWCPQKMRSIFELFWIPLDLGRWKNVWWRTTIKWKFLANELLQQNKCVWINAHAIQQRQSACLDQPTAYMLISSGDIFGVFSSIIRSFTK